MAVDAQQIFDMLMDSQYWPPEQMLEYQRSQLEQLLRHARTNVPFYKTRLDCVFRRDGSIDWDCWAEIPIVTRADLRDRRNEMQATVLPPGHGPTGVISSSGSTGVSIQITIPKIMTFVAGQAWRRAQLAHKIDVSKGYLIFRTLNADGSNITYDMTQEVKGAGEVSPIAIKRGLSTPQKLELVKQSGLRILLDTSIHVEILAHENIRQGRPVKLDVVIGIGMGFTSEQEALILASFGARIFSPYSSKEGALMASQCPVNRKHFHITSEQLISEVVDEYDRLIEDGKVGRSIITPLFNTAQPLIRYDQGDLVAKLNDCGCQVRLPVFTQIAGRSDPIFRFPGRDVVIARVDDVLVQSALCADAFQFAQVAALEVHVRYLAVQEADNAAVSMVRQHLSPLFGSDVMLNFIRVDEIPQNAGGKQQRFVREHLPQ